MYYPQTNLSPGDMQLYDNSIPGAPAGNYQVSVTQAMPNAITNQFSQLVRQEFVVNAPQFSIGSSEIHSVFPCDQSNGNFSLNLPYVTFNTPALPWERLIDNGQPNTIPWMALLIVSSEEVTTDPSTGTPLINSSVQDFLKAEPAIVKPDIQVSSLSAETLQSRLTSILLKPEIFTLVTPRMSELASLAHVREVNPSSQVVKGTTTDGWYSELLANRFPVSVNPVDTSGMKNFALVVSLEGLSAYLVDAPAWPVGTEHVQLAVLSSWTFTSALQAGQTFAELATHLSTQAAPPNATNTLLRVPVTDNGSAAAQRILQGYTALSYHTEPGDETFSWYRGPFTPFPAQNLPNSGTHYVHPSQALIYDQANAVFDTSYSAAWSIGRLMALSHPVFVDTVQTVRKRIISQHAKLLQRSKMPHLSGITDLSVLASSGLTRKMFASRVVSGMGAELTASFHNKPDAGLPVRKAAVVNHLYPNEDMPVKAAAQTKWFLQKPEVRQFLLDDSSDAMSPLSDWLAQLILLQNVPFSHMVSDQRMLPQESIRFFYVDPNWLKALFDGAISVGAHNSLLQSINAMIAPVVWNASLSKAAHARDLLLKRPTGAVPPIPALPAAGMLIRSALIAGWPGMQVSATASGDVVNIKRMAHLSPTVLLVLWDQAPDTVAISQPQQGISFGAADGWIIPLRSLAAPDIGATIGRNFPGTGSLTQFMRTDNEGKNSNVLNIQPSGNVTTGYLAPALVAALGIATLSPSQFAIEMLQTPEQIKFNPPGN